jgi:hypothetical protein
MSLTHPRRSGAAIAAAWTSAVLLGCGAQSGDEVASIRHLDPVPSVSTDSPPTLLEVFAGKAAEHACQHAQLGPFADAVASLTQADAPDVSAVHHTYRLLLTPGSATGWVSYLAARDGAQAIGIGRGELLQVVDAENTPVAYETYTFAGCTALESAHLLTFTGNTQYWLELQAEPGIEITLFVEYLDAFVQRDEH